MKNYLTILGLVLFVSLSHAQSTSLTTTSSSNISVSVSSDNEDYSYSARFDKDKTTDAKNVLVKTLGNPNETDRTAYWEGKGYSVSLRQGKVKMKMDKDEVTKAFQVKFEDVAEQVSESIGSTKTPKPPMPPKTH